MLKSCGQFSKDSPYPHGPAEGCEEMSSSVRRRAVAASRKPAEDEVREKEAPVEQHLEMDAGTYWLTRIVFTRSIGFVYCEQLSISSVHACTHTRTHTHTHAHSGSIPGATEPEQGTYRCQRSTPHSSVLFQNQNGSGSE